MKFRKSSSKLTASLVALSMTAAAALSDAPVLPAPSAEAVSASTRVRVDINRNDGRKALYARNAENWVWDGSAYKTSTGVTVKISNGSGSGSLDCTNNKKLQKYDGTTPYYNADGVFNKDNDTSGALKVEISGLSDGVHSFSGWHSCLYGVTASSLKISLNGKVVQTGIPCPSNVTNDNDAGRSYVEFTGTSATILIQGEGNQSYSNAWLNAFEIDGASPFDSISKISPEDKSIHSNIEDGLSWTAGTGASSHDVYIGTDPEAVLNATKSSPEYKGTVNTPHFDLDSSYSSIPTYYWRVDEVSASGTVKGAVYSFQLNRLAFPTAEGYGRWARGGRGGYVYHVTNLNDSGEGSLRYGLETLSGARTIVFDVGGVIELKDTLWLNEGKGDVYVAGQTAPGDGITLIKHDFGGSGAEDAIIRDIRVRVGDSNGEATGGMGLMSCNNTIIDHCSISWATDEGFSSRSASNISFQWNIIAETLNNSVHYDANDRTKTERHSFAASISGNVGSFHHNLLVNNTGRNWSLAGGMEQDAVTYGGALDIRNNVVYNWRDRTTDGGVRRLNFVNNYYKGGAVSNTNLHVVSIDGNQLNTYDCQKMYVSGNIMTDKNGTQLLKASDDAWSKGKAVSSLYNCTINDVRLTSPFCESYVSTDSAEEAYKKVTDTTSGAGANVPKLDYLDSRYHDEVINGKYNITGSKDGLAGIIDSQTDAGGYPDSSKFKGGTAPTDTDRDGMPDSWETQHGLDPGDASDSPVVSLSADDYTNLEMYLNELAGDPVEFNGAPPRSAFENFEAEEYDSENGTKNEDGTDETHVAYIENGDYIAFRSVDFETGARSFSAKLSGNVSDIDLYIDSIGTAPAASVHFSGTGSWSTWEQLSANIKPISGKHTLYLVFRGGDGFLLNLDSFVFGRENVTLSGDLLTGVSVSDGALPYGWRIEKAAAAGSPVFGDRAFTFDALPDELSGAEQLLTSCDAKGFEGDAATLTAAKDIDLFIALDSRMPEAPSWLSGYELTEDTAVSSNGVTFNIYKTSVPQGETVTIGGNAYSYSVVNYTVFAAEQLLTEPTEPPTEPPTDAPTEPHQEETTSGDTLLGDANCDGSVTLNDAVAILQHIANNAKYGLSSQGMDNADVFERGKGVSGFDALAIQMMDAGVISGFPVDTL